MSVSIKREAPSKPVKALVKIKNISGYDQRVSLSGRLVKIANGSSHMVHEDVATELTPRGSGKHWTVVAEGSSRTEVKDNA